MSDPQKPSQATVKDMTPIEIKILREVNMRAEDLYEVAVALGDHAAYAIQKSHRSQLTGLENVAESAFKTTDVFDYIKRQTARYRYWREAFPGHTDDPYGKRLLQVLEEQVKDKQAKIVHNLAIGDATDEEKYLGRRIYLLLIRQFIRQMVIQFEFRVNFTSGNGNKRS